MSLVGWVGGAAFTEHRKLLMVLDLGTSLELNFMQFRIEPTSRRSNLRDFEFFENSAKN